MFTCLLYVALLGWMGQRAVGAVLAGGTVAPWLVAAVVVSAATTATAIEAARRKLRVLDVT
jgi:hypothetical protein